MNKDEAWAKETSYHDPKGRCLVEFEIIEGPERGTKLYKGKITLNVRETVVTPRGPMVQERQMPFEFDFPEGKGFNYCKKHFDEEATAAVKEWEAAQKKAKEDRAKTKQIATPTKAILGADGRPVG